MALRRALVNSFVFLAGVKATTPTMDVAQTAVATADLSTLVTALTAADLVGAVSDDGSGNNITVFAPLNSAFDALATGVLNTLLLPVNKDALTSVLTYHVASGATVSSDLTLNQQIPTLQTGSVTVTSLTPATINDAEVVTPDVMATNGVVHIIDTVLMPQITFPDKNIVETVNGTSMLSTLTAAVVAAGLGGALSGSNLTVFAPTDDAFTALGADTVSKLLMTDNLGYLASILQHHVAAGAILSTGLPNTVQTLNGTFMSSALEVNATDYLCSGGSVVHIINEVLIPSWFSMDLLADATTSASGGTEADAASLPFAAPLGRALALFFAMWMFH